MIFIKNYVENLKGADVRISALKEGNKTTVSLSTETDKVDLAVSEVEGVYESIRNSVKYIRDITKDDALVDENFISTPILDKKATEIAFFLKGTKMVLSDTIDLPNTIGIYEENPDNKKHYPRDMIVFLVPNTVDGKKSEVSIVMDKRNLGGDVIIYDMKDFSILCMYFKWPIWANLKFPAYVYLTLTVDGETTPWKAFKLGSSTCNLKNSKKTMIKNQIIDVEVNEAKDYLDESFRIMEEKAAERKQNEKPRKKYNKPDNHRGNNMRDNNMRSKSYGNQKQNSFIKDRTGFPSKYSKDSNRGGFNKGKSRNFNNKNHK